MGFIVAARLGPAVQNGRRGACRQALSDRVIAVQGDRVGGFPTAPTGRGVAVGLTGTVGKGLLGLALAVQLATAFSKRSEVVTGVVLLGGRQPRGPRVLLLVCGRSLGQATAVDLAL